MGVFFDVFNFFIYLFVYSMHVCMHMCVLEVKGKLIEVGSLLLPRGAQGSN